MQYTVLARKYRPQQFDDVVGQEHITRTLKNAIGRGRVAHAYLFVGPRGIGKTTTARILAKALNCVSGPTPAPCGECDSCREITGGTNLDVLEIDGASNRGIDEIRAIRDNVRYAPARGPYKIYIIDEVHQITRDAFNALLKTLEEPPPHVKFFFATTEPQKVPSTILSRCQRFDLRRIPAALITERLGQISALEGIQIEPAARQAIARAAEGGMRDALSLLDQLIAFCGERITEEDVVLAYGLSPRQQVVSLARAILSAAHPEALRLIHESYWAGRDLPRLLLDLVALFRDLVVIKAAGPQAELVDVEPAELAQLGELAAGVELDRLVRILDLVSAAEGRLRQVVSHRALLEMTLVRAAEVATQPSLDSVLRTVQRLREEQGGAAPAGGGTRQPDAPPPAHGGGSGSGAPGGEGGTRTPASPRPRAGSAAASAPAEPQAGQAPVGAQGLAAEPAPPAQAAVEAPPPPAEEVPGSVEALWKTVLDRLPASLLVRPYLAGAIPQGPTPGGEWAIAFTRAASAHREYVDTVKYRRLIGGLLTAITGREWRVAFTILDEPDPPEEPAAARAPESGGAANGLEGLARAVVEGAEQPAPVGPGNGRAAAAVGPAATDRRSEEGGRRAAAARRVIRRGLERYEKDSRVERALKLFGGRLVEIRE